MLITRVSVVFVLVMLAVSATSARERTPGESELWRLMDPPRAGGSTDAILGSIGRRAWVSDPLHVTGRWVFQRITVPGWSSFSVHRAGTVTVTATDLNRLRKIGGEVAKLGKIDLTLDSGTTNAKEEIVVLQILDELRLASEVQHMVAADDALWNLLSEPGMRLVTAAASWHEAEITRALKATSATGAWTRVEQKAVSITFSSKETGKKTITISPETVVAYQYACFCWSKKGDVKIVRDIGQRTLCPSGYREPGPPPRKRVEHPRRPCPKRPLDASREERITPHIERMDVTALVGQVLAVGYARVGERTAANRQFSNERLAELVRRFQIGTALIYGFNLPPAAATDDEMLSSVVGLTRSLQGAARDSLPLLIAVDQEGGFEDRITRGVTRMPSPIFFGATRDVPLAERAAAAVATELRALGVTMVFGPIADINTNQTEDVIGRRAFSSERDIVARLALAWAQGFRSGGVLPVAKHYPGHGDATTDPHYGAARIKYASKQELIDHDIVPFRELACDNVPGIMTSHMMTPFDLERQVTISPAAVGYLRKDLGYDGVVVSDDIVDMTGALMNGAGEIVRTHAEVAIQALQAGHDIIVFGCISDRESDSPERTMTEKEFADVHAKIVEHFQSSPQELEMLRAHVRRVLRAKAEVCELDDAEACTAKFDAARFRAQVEKDRPIALEVARASAILITENGRAVGQLSDSKYFRAGKGPLNNGQAIDDTDRVVLISPVHYPPDEFVDAATRDWITKDRLQVIRVLYGFSYDDRKWAVDAWQQEPPVYSRRLKSGVTEWDYDAIDATVRMIVRAAASARVVVFGVINTEHIVILERVCKALRSADKQLFVLLYKEPYFLPRTVYEQENVSVLYLSPIPTTSVAADLLFGRTLPKPAYDLSVPLVDIVNHPRGMPVQVE